MIPSLCHVSSDLHWVPPAPSPGDQDPNNIPWQEPGRNRTGQEQWVIGTYEKPGQKWATMGVPIANEVRR